MEAGNLRGDVRGFFRTALRVALAWFMLIAPAWAGGPRYVTGPPYFTGPAGVPVGWRLTQLTYTTDPGDLSANVNHAAADAMVAAAAGVWNLPVANITIAQSGELAEDVTGENSYLGPGGLVFPADVMSTNAAAIPIAVIYDSDGAITDLMLGSGAGLPAECAQNGVTESVDAFDPAGYILHAIVVVNGRCTGTAPQAQLQLQYQLMRVFGRVLGLAWSQTNDNVFTGATTPSYAQELNWPIMHPIDIICGSYSYQCLPNPFQLRPDDIAAMVTVYPVTQAAAGKQVSLANATGITGLVMFPSGEGMAGVNVLVKRQTLLAATTDLAYEASAVSGTFFRRAATSPFVAAGADAPSSMGTQDQNYEGWYGLQYLPMFPGQTAENLLLTLEPVNPLYIGEHSVGPYALGMVALSGTAPSIAPQFGVLEGGYDWLVATIPTAPATCSSGTDGTLSAPMEVPSTGWWNGLLCGFGHSSYVGVDVKPARTFTVEVTALNEQGLPTTSKAMPAIGIYGPTDQPGDLPSVAVQATAFQGWTTGTTTVHTATGTMTGVRIGIADERGDGRPDFAYQARLFYADSVTPAMIGLAGGTVTITGSGFRNGNAVSIHGVPVPVVSWSANTIVVKAPAMSAVGAASGVGVDVQVSDLSTGATTVMSAALTYTANAGLPNAMRLVSVQTATMYVGDIAATPFAVQVVEADGVTPVVGDTVVFSATTGSAQFGCGSAPCSVVTNAQGMAQTSVEPTVAGTITVQAADGALGQSGSFTALPQIGSINLLAAPTGALNVGVMAGTPFAVQILDANGHPMGNVPVTFSVVSGSATFSKCANALCVVTSDGGGGSGTWVTPGSIGPVTIRVSLGDIGVNDTFTGASNVDMLQIVATPTQPAYPATPAGLFAVQLDTPQGYGDAYEAVTFTAPPGVVFDGCGTNVCVGTSNGGGWVGFHVMALAPGTYTLTAAFGAVTQTQVFIVGNHVFALNLISTPGTNVPPMVPSATPFAVQLLEDGVPVGGVNIALSGKVGDVTISACGQQSCGVFTDANGIAAASVVPLRAGVISLTALFAPITVGTSFTAAGVPDKLNIVDTPPAGGALPGVFQFLAVQLIGPDGVAGVPNNDLTWTVLSGPFSFTSCQVATCTIRTDPNGYAAIGGMAWGAGPVTIQITNGQVSQMMQFNAVTLPDVLQVLSAPASGSFTGQAAAAPFAVQAFFNGGTTPVSGKSVTVSVANGSAAFAACGGASSCTLTTDANGKISTLVTALSAGTITLQVNDGGVIASATFTAVMMPDVMIVQSSPQGSPTVGSPTAQGFAVGVFAGDGVTPRVGKTVVFSVTAGSAVLGCGAASCSVLTGANGSAAVTVTPLAAGLIQLTGVEGTLSQTVSFTAVNRPDVMYILAAPANGTLVGNPGTLTVQVVSGDGVTLAAGRSVTVSVTNGQAVLNACGASTCTLMANAQGEVSTGVVPTAAGVVGLTAVEVAGGAAAFSAAFTAGSSPDRMAFASTPAASVYQGFTAASPLSVRVTLADGATPAAGIAVTFSAPAGSVLFGACETSTCTVTTGANGIASTTVKGVGVGAVQLTASAAVPTGVLTLSTPLTVAANDFAVTTSFVSVFVAEGAAVPETLSLFAAEDGSHAAGQPVQWSGGGGFTLAAAGSVTDANGAASMASILGPLAGGAQASATGCAWTTVCASFTATGVGVANQLLTIVSGGQQSVSGGAAYAPLGLEVVDTSGHPVVGASVSIYQTVTAVNAACPAQGRCPAAPVIASNVVVMTSGGDGMVWVAPLSPAGAWSAGSTQTEIAASVGTQGFVTTVLSQQN